MKQVTMESVKQRIADLESAGKVVGGLSLSSEFELACLRELVAVTAQRDALAAEFAKFKTAHPQPFGPEMMKALDAYEKYQDEVPETGMLNAFFILRNSIRVDTPATDAAIAALRAEGVDLAISHLVGKFNGHGIGVPVMALEHLARQLRESKGEVSNG